MNVERVHVVVVAYGHAVELERALVALGGNLPVVVVDNSSSSEVEAAARRQKAAYTDAGSNLGFAAGANLALKLLELSPPENVLLLNPDAVIRPDDLRALVEYMETSDRLAAVAPRLFGRSTIPERVAWPFPSPWRAWIDAVGLGHVFPGDRRGFVIGAVLLLRWAAIRDVGPFDERFFLYCEETDWQRRAADAGWCSDVCPTAAATHLGAGTSDDGDRRETLFHAAHEMYIRKWFGTRGWLTYRAAAGLGAALRSVLLRGERRALAKRRALLYLRGPRRCAGLLAPE